MTEPDHDAAAPPPDAPLPHAFQWFVEFGEANVFAVGPDMLLADAATAPLFGVFNHPEVWRWAHDQSQAVVGWQPLPFLDGRTARLLWTALTGTGAIAGAVIALGAPRQAAGMARAAVAGEDLAAVFPGVGEQARALRARLAALLGTPLSVRLTGPAGAGKAFVASRLLERQGALPGARTMDPLVLNGDQVGSNPVWLERLRDAVDRGRPVLFLDVDRIPDSRIHAFLPLLQKARERRSPVVCTHLTEVSDFAQRMWSRALRDAVALPGLRPRPEDLEEVARAVWRTHFGAGSTLRLAPDALRLLAGVAWQGNVAELEDILVEAHARSGGGRVEAWALRVPVRRGTEAGTRLEDAEQAAIADALRRAGGNKRAAAGLLGISRSTLYRKMGQYGLDGAAG